jgi:hypothetical protein
MVDALSTFLGRVLSTRGKELVEVGGATIRNVARGVVVSALGTSVPFSRCSDIVRNLGMS